MISFEMHFYVTKTPNGLYHVQNYVMGMRGQHHIHDEESFKRWRKGIDQKFIHVSNGSCDCGLTKSGQVREYDGREWFNERFEK